MRCNVCGHEANGNVEQTAVRSNVRKFAGELFTVWRCPACKSIHARDEVDLAHYYADYPFHKLSSASASFMLTAMYRNYRSRLERAGVGKDSAVLDFGCGSGALLKQLAADGYRDLHGYDEYSESYADKSVLARSYDCVVTQDVIEHVAEPMELVRTLHQLVKPGGVVVIGTPNAEAIDLSRPEERVHTLHQPYHRHILSKQALLSLGHELGWHLLKYYPTMYANTRVPFVNTAFVNHYFQCFDNNVDIVLEPIKANWKVLSPVTLAHALFGSFWAVESDVMALFRRS